MIVELEVWLRELRAKLSGNNDTIKAINYCLNRWASLSRSLGDGRFSMLNMPLSVSYGGHRGTKNWTFARSDEGGRRAAAIYGVIATANRS